MTWRDASAVRDVHSKQDGCLPFQRQHKQRRGRPLQPQQQHQQEAPLPENLNSTVGSSKFQSALNARSKAMPVTERVLNGESALRPGSDRCVREAEGDQPLVSAS